MKKHPNVIRIPLHSVKTELHATGDKPPNRRPLLKFYDYRKDGHALIAEIELSDFTSCAQWFYEGELRHNLLLKWPDPKYKQRLRKIRKALGYSYP